MSTGKEVAVKIEQYMLRCTDSGNDTFVNERLVEGSSNFFKPIKKNNLNTGLKKVTRPNKVASFLNEDKDDVVVSFAYPLTSMKIQERC